MTTLATPLDAPDLDDAGSEAQVDDYVFVEMPTNSFEGDVAAITDKHIILVDFTKWSMGTNEPVYGEPGQEIKLPLADALSVDVQDRVA